MANKKVSPRNERSGATSKAKKTKARKALKKAVSSQKMATKAYKREKKALAKTLSGAGASAGIKAGKAMKKSAPSSAQKAYKQGAMARNATQKAQYKVDGLRREAMTPAEKNAMRANARSVTSATKRPITDTMKLRKEEIGSFTKKKL